MAPTDCCPDRSTLPATRRPIFGGYHLHLGSVAETGGALAENIGGATLGNAESTLAVSAQRPFALNYTVSMTAKGRLGWSHEFADNTARVAASFAGLSGSGFALNSAPIGRDARAGGTWCRHQGGVLAVAMFVGYGGVFERQQQRSLVQRGRAIHWLGLETAAGFKRRGATGRAHAAWRW